MSHLRIRFARMIQRLESAFVLTVPMGALREGSDEIASSHAGFPEADVSSLSIALYQMGLCKHLPDAPAPATAPHIA
jgi:hypothetical protein